MVCLKSIKKIEGMKPTLIVICGATATGKSSLALALAQRLNSIIISADSRQIYREFDIGTAKPTLGEQAKIPHYLIDICDPTQILTLAQYQEKAQRLIKTYHHKNPCSPPLFVGGTGLYIKSVVKGMKIPKVSPQPILRQQLQTLGQPLCYQFLQQIDPVAAQKIHPHDEVRTLRALEVYYVTAKPISTQQGENPPSYSIIQIGLSCEADCLRKRIAIRTEQMLEKGLVEEVKTLGDRYGWDLPLLNTLGYGEIKQYLQGKIDLSQAKELIVIHTAQFAKRQRTWFRAYPEIHWFNLNSPQLLDQVWHYLQTKINSSSITLG